MNSPIETESREGSHFTLASNERGSNIPLTPDVLGNKGLKLIEMVHLGDIPVPPFFILSTDAWRETLATGHELPSDITKEVSKQIGELEKQTGRVLDWETEPLFVSVRSGARVSMPGAMNTILNVGINPTTIGALAEEIGETNAWEAYFNLVTGLGTHAYGVEAKKFDAIKNHNLSLYNVSSLHELPLWRIQSMVEDAKTRISAQGSLFPDDPTIQIRDAITAVFHSWMSPEAKAIRERYGYSEDVGTAVIVQQMVWGNANREGAGSAVLFTRDPKELGSQPVVYFASHEQGTSVVGGNGQIEGVPVGELPIPTTAQEQIAHISESLEAHFKRPQDVELTFDGKQVWVLQTRDERLAPPAYFRLLQERVARGYLTLVDAKRRMRTIDLHALLTPDLDPRLVIQAKKTGNHVGSGIRISLGNGSGHVVHSVEEANKNPEWAVVLVMSTVDLVTIANIPKNVTALVAGNGGAGSHVGVSASRLDIPVVFGVDPIKTENLEVATVDGNSGDVFSVIIPRAREGINTILTAEERNLAEDWLEERKKNPWAFVGRQEGHEEYDNKARQAMDGAQKGMAPKALEYTALNALIPEEIRIPYEILSVRDKSPEHLSELTKLVGDKLALILESGQDATIRACMSLLGQGVAPWWYVTKPSDIESVFTNPENSKYGTLSRWLPDQNLSEILVGAVPKGKLDPEIQKQECAWELSCGETGEVTLQVNLFTAHHRQFETAGKKNLFTITYQYNSRADALVAVGASLDEDLAKNEEAQRMVTYVAGTVTDWWERYSLQKILSAVTGVFPNNTTPVLEGQARINPDDPDQRWCKIYGIKIDPVKNN